MPACAGCCARWARWRCEMKPVVRRFLQIGVLIVVQALALFLAAGKFNWAEGWVYMGLYLGCKG